mmetsp:Transcript_22522/g.62560  ORF Transcript_22522/g.62560 Transcript_22522/m.62560 type:complete len:98 (-) Transcript_22522:2852-3145(-)
MIYQNEGTDEKGSGGYWEVARSRKLHSSGKYHVTFMTDCDQWVSGYDFRNRVCSSFHCTPEAIGIDVVLHPHLLQVASLQFIRKCFDKVLENHRVQS